MHTDSWARWRYCSLDTEHKFSHRGSVAEILSSRLLDATLDVSPDAPIPTVPVVDLFRAGGLVELSAEGGSGVTTIAVSSVRKAQVEGHFVAWVQSTEGTFFPPDVAAAGVDLEALVVVHVPVAGLARAAELLLRSGAFGLVVLDLREGVPRGMTWHCRLHGVARNHQARLILLTRKSADEPSLGALIGLRLEPRCERVTPGFFRLECTILKDKMGLHALPLDVIHSGPEGLL